MRDIRKSALQRQGCELSGCRAYRPYQLFTRCPGRSDQ
jgi:hypothetical protein